MPRSAITKPAKTPKTTTASLNALLGSPSLPAAVVARLQALLEDFKPREKARVALWHDDEKPASHLAVVARDQSFLTDTVTLCANRWGLDIATLRHPVIGVTRDPHGKIIKLGNGGLKETLIYLLLPPLAPGQAEQVAASVKAGLDAAQNTVADFAAMRDRVADERVRMASTRQASREELQFMDWLLDNHFILMGMRQYRYRDSAQGPLIQVVPGSGLGILRHSPSRSEHPMPVSKMGTSLAAYLKQPGAVIISKAFTRAPIHRDAAMDYLALRTLDSDGGVVSEWRLLGLFTSRAHTTYVGDVPLLAAKLQAVRDKLGYEPGGYSARVLQNVLETWPRDELFLSDADELAKLAAQAVAMRQQSDVAVLVRHAPREEAISVQMLVPLPRYESRLRREAVSLLERMTGGNITDQRLEMGLTDVVRLFFRVHVENTRKLDERALTAAMHQMVRGWADDVQHILYDKLPLGVATKLWKTIGLHLPSSYRASQTPAQAAADLLTLHTLPEGGVVRLENIGKRLVLLAYRAGGGWPLHQILPVLDSFGLKTAQEQHYTLPVPGGTVAIQVIEIEGEYALSAEALEKIAVLAGQALRGLAESDCLNQLVISADLPVEAIGWLRAWTACLQQADRRFAGDVVRCFLTRNPLLAKDLVALFRARLQPGVTGREKLEKSLNASLSKAIAALPTAEDERIGVAFHQLIGAMLRTNAWQGLTPALAFKLESGELRSWPKPLVYKEIFVYHPLVEGVHLRGGPVARGGLRNSDRPYDYRIEVLGLQQAQQRKNAIIVPVGAKGGFVVKDVALWSHYRALASQKMVKLPQNDVLTAQERARLAYQIFVSALLSVSDTYRKDGKVVGPRDVVRADGDDPYLVVAADKGTATYSNTANALSENADFWDGVSHGFWLGDAFASGGSNGYDHKELGITARGAWLSVEHHLKALDIVPSAKKPIVMVGIGDPSGDVFGNGVVREKHTLLVAAFNHKYIFLDPNPDAAKSFAERERLLREVKGWDGYNEKLISNGGGVFSRSAKVIPLSAAMQERLGLKKKDAAPEEVIRAILKAPVDVIWNGGIGTYIRASEERDDEVGDKANDAVRVSAKDVRAKVIGEGGNLGITPRGRIELSLRGVLLNSDALDNSAGVDTSDHEVNLKILLGTMENRNALLKKCTDDIAAAVLTDNVRQNLAISLEVSAPATEHHDLFAMQESLLKRGVLSEEVDNLPALMQLLQRESGKYTRPEIAGLLAGTKMVLRDELLTPEMKALLQGDLGRAALRGYFPPSLPAAILNRADKHPLAGPITATVLANRVVNRLGLLMVPHLCADLGCTPATALGAVLMAEDWVAGDSLWAEMDALEGTLPMPALLAAYQRVRAIVATLAAWLVRQGLGAKEAEELGAQVKQAPGILPGLLSPTAKQVLAQREKGWRNLGYGDAMATRLSLLSPLAIVPDAVQLRGSLKAPAGKAALQLQLNLGELLHLPALMQRSRVMAFADGWSRQAVMAMLLEFLNCQRCLTQTLLARRTDVAAWKKKHADALGRYNQTVAQVLHEKNLSVAMLSVVVGRLRELAP